MLFQDCGHCDVVLDLLIAVVDLLIVPRVWPSLMMMGSAVAWPGKCVTRAGYIDYRFWEVPCDFGPDGFGSSAPEAMILKAMVGHKALSDKPIQRFTIIVLGSRGRRRCFVFVSCYHC